MFCSTYILSDIEILKHFLCYNHRCRTIEVYICFTKVVLRLRSEVESHSFVRGRLTIEIGSIIIIIVPTSMRLSDNLSLCVIFSYLVNTQLYLNSLIHLIKKSGIVTSPYPFLVTFFKTHFFDLVK